MTFQQAINQYPSLRTLYSKMELQTPMARTLLLQTPLTKSQQWIEQQWQQTTECQNHLSKLNLQTSQRFFMHLSTIHDISGSLKLLQQNQILDDIALFEIKAFAINIKKLNKDFTSPLFPMPDLQEVINILDPEKTESMQFYIYSAYSQELSQIRKEFQQAKNEENEQKAHSLYVKSQQIENTIREQLGIKLFPYIPALLNAIKTIANIDLSFAKAKLSNHYNLQQVEITQERTLTYNSMFHPLVKEILEENTAAESTVDTTVEEVVEETVATDEEIVKAAEETDAEEDAAQEKEKKFGKKKKAADKKAEAYEAKIAELEDRVKRQMAEFENYRKRTEKEKAAMFEMGAKSVVEKILPVVDNFERGLAAVPDTDKEGAFASGMNLIYKQMMTELEGLGVKPIEAVGNEFDPNLHNAVMQVESDEYEEGIVAQELLKGYTYRESVVRHSMVAVTQ